MTVFSRYRITGIRDALIISIGKFRSQISGQNWDRNKHRPNYEVDADQLQETLEALDFHIFRKLVGVVNYSDAELAVQELIDRNSERDADMLCICILTHGQNNNELMFSDREVVSLTNFYEPIMAAHHFTDVPKLFIVQSCRNRNQSNLSPLVGQLPMPRHTGIFWASPPAHKAFIEGKELSSFVKYVWQIFERHGSKEKLLDMSVYVNDLMTANPRYGLIGPRIRQYDQLSWFEHGYTKQLYFYTEPGDSTESVLENSELRDSEAHDSESEVFDPNDIEPKAFERPNYSEPNVCEPETLQEKFQKNTKSDVSERKDSEPDVSGPNYAEPNDSKTNNSEPVSKLNYPEAKGSDLTDFEIESFHTENSLPININIEREPSPETPPRCGTYVLTPQNTLCYRSPPERMISPPESIPPGESLHPPESTSLPGRIPENYNISGTTTSSQGSRRGSIHGVESHQSPQTVHRGAAHHAVSRQTPVTKYIQIIAGFLLTIALLSAIVLFVVNVKVDSALVAIICTVLGLMTLLVFSCRSSVGRICICSCYNTSTAMLVVFKVN